MVAQFSNSRFLVILALLDVLSLCVGASRLHRWDGISSVQRQRELLQDAESVEVKKVNFTTLAQADLTNGDIFFNETAFLGKLPITPGTQANGEQPIQFGAYDLSPFMVRELTTMVIQQMPLVPPEESQRIGPVEHPGVQITGGSVRDANDSSLLRVPTVYAPFRSGSVFDFGEHSGAGPGATLRLANVTFVMENVTWYDLVGGRSGLRPFFNLQQDARFCLTNSMLVLESCEGYQGWHMMCCKDLEGCGVLFSADALINLGFADVAEQLTIMTCHDARPRSDDPNTDTDGAADAGGGGGGSARTTLIVAATTVCAALVLFFGITLVLLRRHQRAKGSLSGSPTHGSKFLFSRRAPGSSAQARLKSEPAQQESLPSAHDKRARERAARSKAPSQAVSGALSGLTEQALLDREHRPLDINRTDSSPADNSPLDGGCCGGQYIGPHPMVQAVAERADSPTAASAASGTLRAQHAQHMSRARSRDELHADVAHRSQLERRARSREHMHAEKEPAPPSIPTAGQSHRKASALQQHVGDVVAQHAPHDGRGRGRRGHRHSLSPTRGAVGDSGQLAADRKSRSFMLGQVLGEDAELSDREESDWIEAQPHGDSPLHRAASPPTRVAGDNRANGRRSGPGAARTSQRPPPQDNSKPPPRKPSPQARPSGHDRRARRTTDAAHLRQDPGHPMHDMHASRASPRNGRSGSGRSGSVPRRSSRESRSSHTPSRAGGRSAMHDGDSHVQWDGSSKLSMEHASGPLGEHGRDHRARRPTTGGMAAGRSAPQLAPRGAAGGGASSEMATGARTTSRTLPTTTLPDAQQPGDDEETVDAHASYMESPGKGAGVEERRRFLMRQLDALGAGEVVLGRFVLLDSSERCHGGQAVVQFAHGKLDKQDYAIKFFLSKKGFAAEEALYRHTTLGQLLPQVTASCPEGSTSIRDPWGRALPACMVMERGEALDLWMERAQPDKYMAFSMIANMAERVCDLHARGWVHRDLKPANIMWLPRTNSWTVIDFGCAAPRGAEVPLSFTLGYAAPEVAVALAQGSEVVTAECAMDAWAIGVIAFELLTGKPAFKMSYGKQDVVEQLVGHAELPWEGSRLTPGVLRKLGAHKKDVLGLLRRDPEERLTLYQFLNSCSQMLNSTLCVASAD